METTEKQQFNNHEVECLYTAYNGDVNAIVSTEGEEGEEKSLEITVCPLTTDGKGKQVIIEIMGCEDHPQYNLSHEEAKYIVEKLNEFLRD
jgi:VCBS repeat-containing protein